MSQCLYIMSVPSGRFKIGVTSDPWKRRSEIQIGNHEPVTLDGAWVYDDYGINARDVERELHQLFSPIRQTGEWFKGPEGDTYASFDEHHQATVERLMEKRILKAVSQIRNRRLSL
jgi:hypothetical protein